MTLDIALSIRELDIAIGRIVEYANRLDAKAKELVDSLVRNGEEYALFYLSSHIDTGETIATTYGYREGNKGFIISGGAAIWLEFGTGVVANNCAPGTIVHPLVGVELVINGIGTYGKGHGSDPNGWWYYDEDGRKHHTYGIPALKYMWNTAQQLKREYPELAKELFKT